MIKKDIKSNGLWTKKILKKNEYTNPGIKLLDVKKIVIHWTANLSGADANDHYKYFNGSCIQARRYASAHFFVDKIRALQILNLDEVGYHCNDKGTQGLKLKELKASKSDYKEGNGNLLTLGIELCVEKDGTFHKNTIERAENIAVELCLALGLNPLKDIVRHYDVTGKECPKPMVKNPEMFTRFKNDVNTKVKGRKAPGTTKPVKQVDKPKPTPVTSYKVKKGDTFSAIAEMHNLKTEDLIKLNPNVKPEAMQIGTVIKLKKPATTPAKPATPKEIGKVEVLASSLYYYDKADWNKKAGQAKKGDVFTVIEEIKVNGSPMYRLKSPDRFITANKEFVKFTKK